LNKLSSKSDILHFSFHFCHLACWP